MQVCADSGGLISLCALADRLFLIFASVVEAFAVEHVYIFRLHGHASRFVQARPRLAVMRVVSASYENVQGCRDIC